MIDLIIQLYHFISIYCMLLDLDILQPTTTPEEVQTNLYLNEIIFQLTPDE